MHLDSRVRRAAALIGAAFALVLFGASIPLAPSIGGLLVALLLAGSFAVIVVFVVYRDGGSQQRTVLQWTMIAFGLHVVVGLVIASATSLVNYLGPDAVGYHNLAIQLNAAHGGAGAPSLPPGKAGFVEALAFFYRVGAPTLAVGAVMNAGFAAGVVPLMTDAAERLLGRERSRVMPALVTLCPPLLLWSSQVLREAGVAFLMAVLVCASVRLIDRFSMSAVLVLGVASAVLLTFRGPLAYALLMTVVLAVTIGRQNLLVGLANGASFTLMIILIVGVAGLGYSGYRFSSVQDLEDASTFRAAVSSTAASGFDSTTKVRTLSDALAYLPNSVPRTLAGPLPTSVHGLRQVPAAIDAMVWWWFLFHVWRGFRLSRLRGSRRRLLVLVLPAAVVTIVLALSLGNYGLLVRERPQIMLFLLPIAALSVGARRSATSGDTLAAPAVAVT